MEKEHCERGQHIHGWQKRLVVDWKVLPQIFDCAQECVLITVPDCLELFPCRFIFLNLLRPFPGHSFEFRRVAFRLKFLGNEIEPHENRINTSELEIRFAEFLSEFVSNGMNIKLAHQRNRTIRRGYLHPQ